MKTHDLASRVGALVWGREKREGLGVLGAGGREESKVNP